MTSVDYTAIPLEIDPRHQRFVGVAVHGNTPFDVPYISQIDGNLWMGGCADGLVLPAEFRHWITLYPWETYRHGSLQSQTKIIMYDDENATPDLDQIAGIGKWIDWCVKDGPTLLSCQAGLNRSGLLTASYLIGYHGLTAEQAISQLRIARSPAVLCNRTFEEWLHTHEHQLVQSARI